MLLSDDSDLVAEEIEFRQGWNSPSPSRNKENIIEKVTNMDKKIIYKIKSKQSPHKNPHKKSFILTNIGHGWPFSFL